MSAVTAAAGRLGRRYPLALVAAGVVLYATGPVMLQASSLSGPVFSFWRLWTGVAVLGAAVGVQRLRGMAWPARRQWRVAVLAGVAFGMHQLLFFSAIRITTVVDVSLMNALAPVVTACGATPNGISVKTRAGRPLVGPRIRGRDNGATASAVTNTVH